VAEERSAEQIQREIEQSRTALAEAVDQLAYRTDPKRIVNQTKQRLRDKANTTQGRIVIGGAGALVLVLVVRRIRKGRRSD
jgi:Protein of unknown function (DUF3618)